MKHIDIDYHFICNQLSNGLLHVPTKEKLVDGLTKQLSSQHVTLLWSKIGVHISLNHIGCLSIKLSTLK